MKRIPISIFLTALITGLFLLFNKCCNETPETVTEQITHCEIQVPLVDTGYNTVIVTLQQQIDTLQKELNQAHQIQCKAATTAEKEKAGQSKVQESIECDSLRKQVVLFTNWVDSAQQDYEQLIVEQDKLIAMKDSEIVITTASNLQLMNAANEQLKREQQLTEELNTVYKQQKENRFHNKVLAASFLILSGITTTLFIKSGK